MRARSERRYAAARLEMTAMIDVVFLLLVFFVLSVRLDDVPGELKTFRSRDVPGTDIALLRIDIVAGGYAANGRELDWPRMDRLLSRLGRLSPNANVLITCTPDSRHSQLIRVLDLCAKAKLTRLSVMSL